MESRPDAPLQVDFTAGDLQTKIAVLRDQVDLLQVRSEEQRRPWFKESSVLVSAIALVVSFGLGVFTIYDQMSARQVEFIREKSEQLGDVVNKLIDSRRRTAELIKIQNINDRLLQDSLINMSRQMTLEEGQAIVAQLGEHVSINGLLTLGYEYQMDSNFSLARKYFEDAVGRFESMPEEEKDHRLLVYLTALRSIATIYALPDTGFQDLEHSRGYWEAAVGLGETRQDAYSLALFGYTLQSWANAEYFAGERERALALLQEARSAYERMDPLHPMRGQQLTLVDQAAAFYADPELFAGFDQSTAILGEWEVAFPGDSRVTGRAIGIPDPTGAAPTLIIDVFDSSTRTLVRKLQGYASHVDSQTVRIDWQGVGIHAPSGQQLMLSGMSTLTWNEEGSKLEGSETALGLPPVKVILSRPEPLNRSWRSPALKDARERP